MKRRINTYQKGFTLLEILLVIGIMGVIAVFTIAISHSIRNMTKLNDTKSRMEQIAAKAKEFYRSHQELPGPAGTAAPTPPNVWTGEVPVQINLLNMEQKFRLDAWGQYFEYHIYLVGNVTIDGITIPGPGGFHPDANTDINAFSVDGNNAAGVIISLGPNQQQDYTTNTTGCPAPVTPAVVSYCTAGDDILVPINLSEAAKQSALDDLKELQAKVKAFDAIFEGIDNDGDGLPDCDDLNSNSICDSGEIAGCVPQSLGGVFTGFCPPTGGDNDPNCGTATLDNFEAGNYTDCPSGFGARDFICDFYTLADSYRMDPWLNGYVWGCASGCTTNYVPCDPQYHKFFSMGTDETAGTAGSAGPPCVPGTRGDDIIP